MHVIHTLKLETTHCVHNDSGVLGLALDKMIHSKNKLVNLSEILVTVVAN